MIIIQSSDDNDADEEYDYDYSYSEEEDGEYEYYDYEDDDDDDTKGGSNRVEILLCFKSRGTPLPCFCYCKILLKRLRKFHRVFHTTSERELCTAENIHFIVTQTLSADRAHFNAAANFSAIIAKNPPPPLPLPSSFVPSSSDFLRKNNLPSDVRARFFALGRVLAPW